MLRSTITGKKLLIKNEQRDMLSNFPDHKFHVGAAWVVPRASINFVGSLITQDHNCVSSLGGASWVDGLCEG